MLDLTVREVQPNAAVDIQLPDAVKTATERVTADKVADGVWFIAGGSHNSVAIEMKDYMILVETPLNDGRSVPVIAQVKQLAPGQADPLRDQLARPLRPFRRIARSRGGRRDDRHAFAEQAVLREGVRDPEHDQSRRARQVGKESPRS